MASRNVKVSEENRNISVNLSGAFLLVVLVVFVWIVAEGLLFFWTENAAEHHRFVETTSVEQFCVQKDGTPKWSTYENYRDEDRPMLKCLFD